MTLRLRVRLVFVPAALTLIALLLAGCGGADNGAKVEASLRHYISTLTPDSAPSQSERGRRG